MVASTTRLVKHALVGFMCDRAYAELKMIGNTDSVSLNQRSENDNVVIAVWTVSEPCKHAQWFALIAIQNSAPKRHKRYSSIAALWVMLIERKNFSEKNSSTMAIYSVIQNLYVISENMRSVSSIWAIFRGKTIPLRISVYGLPFVKQPFAKRRKELLSSECFCLSSPGIHCNGFIKIAIR